MDSQSTCPLQQTSPFPALHYRPPLPVTVISQPGSGDPLTVFDYRTQADLYLIFFFNLNLHPGAVCFCSWHLLPPFFFFFSLSGTCNGNRCLEAQPGFLHLKGSVHLNHKKNDHLTSRLLAMQIVSFSLSSVCITKPQPHYNGSEYNFVHGAQISVK